MNNGENQFNNFGSESIPPDNGWHNLPETPFAGTASVGSETPPMSRQKLANEISELSAKLGIPVDGNVNALFSGGSIEQLTNYLDRMVKIEFILDQTPPGWTKQMGITPQSLVLLGDNPDANTKLADLYYQAQAAKARGFDPVNFQNTYVETPVQELAQPKQPSFRKKAGKIALAAAGLFLAGGIAVFNALNNNGAVVPEQNPNRLPDPERPNAASDVLPQDFDTAPNQFENLELEIVDTNYNGLFLNEDGTDVNPSKESPSAFGEPVSSEFRENNDKAGYLRSLFTDLCRQPAEFAMFAYSLAPEFQAIMGLDGTQDFQDFEKSLLDEDTLQVAKEGLREVFQDHIKDVEFDTYTGNARTGYMTPDRNGNIVAAQSRPRNIDGDEIARIIFERANDEQNELAENYDQLQGYLMELRLKCANQLIITVDSKLYEVHIPEVPDNPTDDSITPPPASETVLDEKNGDALTEHRTPDAEQGYAGSEQLPEGTLESRPDTSTAAQSAAQEQEQNSQQAADDAAADEALQAQIEAAENQANEQAAVDAAAAAAAEAAAAQAAEAQRLAEEAAAAQAAADAAAANSTPSINDSAQGDWFDQQFGAGV